MADELDNQDTPIVDNPQDDTPPVVVDEPAPEGVPSSDAPVDESVPDADPADPNDTPPTDEAPPVEAVVFDPAAEDFEAKTTEALDKYEIPQEVQAVLDAYKAKIAAPTDTLSEYLVFAGADADDPEVAKERITSLLERETLLTTQREEKPGVYRPNTDKYVEGLPDDIKDYLHHDLANTPSAKYQNITRAEELLYDALAIEGDTVGTVKKRIADVIQLVKGNAILPPSDVPAFIPPKLVLAFKSLDKAERDQIAQYDPANDIEGSNDAEIRQSKLNTLAKIQSGLEGEAREQQESILRAQRAEQQFNNDVATIRDTFTGQFRTQFTENLIKEVKFSDDPVRQSFEAKKLVMMLELGFAQDDTGEYAREALKNAGISFDGAKAAEMLKGVEKAAVELTKAKNQVGPDGKLLNPVSFNKAKATFDDLSRDWQKFAKNILDQQVKVTTEGKAEDVKNEVAKIKVAPKARATTGKAASPSANKAVDRCPYPYGSTQADEWYADRTLQEMAARAAPYRQ